jgi:predicted Zn-dependent peptidase
MIDRKIAPELLEISKIQLVEPKCIVIDQNVSLYYLQNKHIEGFKLDLHFDGGFRNDSRLLAKIANKSALSGTLNKSSNDIENQISKYGGFTGYEYTSEDATLSLLGQNKFFDELTSIVFDAIAHAVIPERDFNQIIATEKQRFIVQNEKVSTKARRLFLKNLYAGNHLSELTSLSDFDTLKREELIQFFNRFYKKGLLKVSLIGNLDNHQIESLTKELRSFCGKKSSKEGIVLSSKPLITHAPIQEKVQSAIRIGKPLFNRTHEDYPAFVLLNTLLGGYFGSRLMKSIREEKGLTYGIGSGIAQSIDHAYFFISTEVNKEKREEAIDLILKELKILQSEKVSEAELNIVKNYSIGQLLKNSDGPFAQMERFLNVEKYGLSMQYYNDLLHTFNECTSDQLMYLANRYLAIEDLSICSAG